MRARRSAHAGTVPAIRSNAKRGSPGYPQIRAGELLREMRDSGERQKPGDNQHGSSGTQPPPKLADPDFERTASRLGKSQDVPGGADNLRWRRAAADIRRFTRMSGEIPGHAPVHASTVVFNRRGSPPVVDPSSRKSRGWHVPSTWPLTQTSDRLESTSEIPKLGRTGKARPGRCSAACVIGARRDCFHGDSLLQISHSASVTCPELNRSACASWKSSGNRPAASASKH
jgi:hypothetical protein